MSSYRGDLSPSDREDIESFKDRRCPRCHGTGWTPARYASGPEPCGCDRVPLTPADPVLARLMKRVVIDPASGCWNWQGSITPNGYGKIGVGGAIRSTHRAAYELAKGLVPKGLVLDHLCKNTLCCNPAHLEAVTQAVNNARSDSLSAQNAAKTQCVKGHPLVGHNIYTGRKGKRACRECAKLYQRRRRAMAHATRRLYIANSTGRPYPLDLMFWIVTDQGGAFEVAYDRDASFWLPADNAPYFSRQDGEPGCYGADEIVGWTFSCEDAEEAAELFGSAS